MISNRSTAWFGKLLHMEFNAAVSHRVQVVFKSAHLSLLANPVRPGLRLQVVLWVPVRVEDDHGVGGRQVDAQATRPRRQQEAEILHKCEVISQLLS